VIDVHNDWQLGANNDLELVSGAQAAKQRLFIRLGTNAGEYPWDQSVGVSWLYTILGAKGAKGDSAAVRQLIVEQIRMDREVAATGEIQAVFNNTTRKMNYSISVRLIDGVNTELVV
jgi:hypothetical protein